MQRSNIFEISELASWYSQSLIFLNNKSCCLIWFFHASRSVQKLKPFCWRRQNAECRVLAAFWFITYCFFIWFEGLLSRFVQFNFIFSQKIFRKNIPFQKRKCWKIFPAWFFVVHFSFVACLLRLRAKPAKHAQKFFQKMSEGTRVSLPAWPGGAGKYLEGLKPAKIGTFHDLTIKKHWKRVPSVLQLLLLAIRMKKRIPFVFIIQSPLNYSSGLLHYITGERMKKNVFIMFE